MIPGFSSFVDLPDILDLTKKEEGVLDVISALFLDSERKNKDKSDKRKQFSKKTKLQVLKKQKYRCKICGKKLDVVDYDHIDGNRANNAISNCQALHPNCHAKKSRQKY